MTEEKKKRIETAMEEVNAMLLRELSYDPELRDLDMITYCADHYRKLEAMLSA